jgi:hypothetical protein
VIAIKESAIDAYRQAGQAPVGRFRAFGGRRTTETGSGCSFSRFWWKAYARDRVSVLVLAVLVEEVWRWASHRSDRGPDGDLIAGYPVHDHSNRAPSVDADRVIMVEPSQFGLVTRSR